MAIKFSDVRSEIEEHIKPNGVGAITGQVMQDAMMSLVDASEAEMSALNQEVDGKLTQLSQEWQEIKDANFNVVVNPHIEVVDMTGVTAATIEPDKYYIFGEVATLAVGFVAAAEGKVGNYAFQFTTPADVATTLSLPLGVKFPKESGSALQIKPNTIYQISILNGLGVATSWEV